MSPPTDARRAGSRLFATYAAASLVPVVVLGLVLAADVRERALVRGLDHARSTAVVVETMAVAPALTRGELDRGLTAGEQGRLRQATDLALYQGKIDRLRLRSFTGAVAFSDDGSVDGGVPADDPAFQAAAAGSVEARVVADPRGVAGRLVEVLTPVVATATGRAVGVLELHLPYAATAAAVRADTTATWLRLAAGLAGLYAVLAGLAWSTGRGLRRLAEDRERQALHDALTGLPNRERFRQRAEQACASGRPGALVLVDLDRFKQVNDTLGHHAGDELLRVVGDRLAGALRRDDTVARLGGDEFGLVLPGVIDRGDVAATLARARDALSREVVLDGVPVQVEASFGVTLFPEHGTVVEQLLQQADAAMYQGKRGLSGVVVFEPGSAPAASPAELALQAELRRGIDRGELVLHYQPKVALGTGRVRSVEALVRWQHPERGLLPPGEFLPLVEGSALVDRFTATVLSAALADCAAWSRAGLDWTVSVNVSARNLESPRFADDVAALLDAAGLSADRLRIEVTETAFAADALVAAESVRALAALGVTVSVDDFGIGYSCLSQLRRMPVREVKVDRLFVAGIETSESDRAIVRSVIALAHGLGCTVTAEGVETPETAAWLREAGCDEGQGWLYARAVPWPELAERFGPAGVALAAVGGPAAALPEAAA